jgi:hypothetical protein
MVIGVIEDQNDTNGQQIKKEEKDYYWMNQNVISYNKHLKNMQAMN